MIHLEMIGVLEIVLMNLLREKRHGVAYEEVSDVLSQQPVYAVVDQLFVYLVIVRKWYVVVLFAVLAEVRIDRVVTRLAYPKFILL